MIKEYIITTAQHYGSIGVAIGLALEFLGLPVPGETLMTFLGYLAWKGVNKSLLPAIIWAVIGTNAGSLIAYFIGFRFGENILIKYGKYVFITKDKIDKTKELMLKNKTFLLLFSRYVPGVRHVVPYLSGISKINIKGFAIYNLIGSILWCVTFVGFGAVLGDKWSAVENLVKGYFFIIVLLAVFIYVVIKYFDKHKKAIFAITLPILLFIKLSEDLIRQELTLFDSIIHSYLFRFTSEGLNVIATTFSYVGTEQFLIIFALLIYLISRRYKKYALYSKILMIDLIASIGLNISFKIIFHRELPRISELVEISGLSFPNSHSMVGLSFYGLILYLCYKNINDGYKKYFAVVSLGFLIFLIGLSRVYLGVNYASDVLAGFAGGFAWLAVFITLVNRSIPKKIIGGF